MQNDQRQFGPPTDRSSSSSSSDGQHVSQHSSSQVMSQQQLITQPQQQITQPSLQHATRRNNTHHHSQDHHYVHHLHLQPPSQNLVHKHSHYSHHQSQRNAARLKQIADYAAQQVRIGRGHEQATGGQRAAEIPVYNYDASQVTTQDHVTHMSYHQQAASANYFSSQPHQHQQLNRAGSLEPLGAGSGSPQLVRPRVGSVSSQVRSPAAAACSSPPCGFAITRSTSFSDTTRAFANDQGTQSLSPPPQTTTPLAYLQPSPQPSSSSTASYQSASASGGSSSGQTMSPSDALSLGINLEQYISKRNERERSRVRNVNDAFDNLKNSLPIRAERQSKRLSKVEILRTAIGYIRNLENILGSKQQQQQQNNMDTSNEHPSMNRGDSLACSTSMSDLSTLLLAAANATNSSANSTASTAPTSTSASPTSTDGNSSSAPYYQLAATATGSIQQSSYLHQQQSDESGTMQNITTNMNSTLIGRQTDHVNNIMANQQQLQHFNNSNNNNQDLMRNLEYQMNEHQYHGGY